MKGQRCAQLVGLLLAVTMAGAKADIVAEIVARVPAHPHSYAEMMVALQELHSTDRVQCMSLGRSHEGRTIAMACVADPACDPRALKKLLIIARQHGNETSGTEAAMALLQHMARTEGPRERALLRRVALLVVPMANPDGAAAGRRANARGVDLNRDWAALSQPETRALEAAFLDWRPDVVVDLHELPVQSAREAYQENFLETIGSAATLPAMLYQTTGQVSAQVSIWMGRYGFPLNVYYDSPGSDLRLCHRHFGLYHQVPSYLFEAKTGPGRDLRTRVAYHVLGVLVVANQLAYHSWGEPPMVAAAPAAEPTAAVTAAAPPATTVALAEPVLVGADEAGVPRVLLAAQVQPREDFSYLTFEVNGTVVALTNRAPYQYLLDLRRCGGGAQQVAVRCFDSSGRCLASDSRSVVLPEASALGE